MVKYKKKNDPPFFVTDVEKMSRGIPMEQKRQTERIRRYFIGFIIFEKRVAWWDDASIRSRTTMLFDPDKERLKKNQMDVSTEKKRAKEISVLVISYRLSSRSMHLFVSDALPFDSMLFEQLLLCIVNLLEERYDSEVEVVVVSV